MKISNIDKVADYLGLEVVQKRKPKKKNIVSIISTSYRF